MEIKTHLASESLSPEDIIVSLGGSVAEPVSYEQPPLTSQQENSPRMNYRQRIAARKMRSTQNQTTCVSTPEVSQVQQCSQSVIQPVPASQVQSQVQVQPDQDPIVPNLGRPSAFRRSSNRMNLSSNRNTSNVPETPNPGVYTESPEYARSRRIRADSIWWNDLITYYSDQNVRFRLSSIQLQELEKLDTKILDIRDNTGKYDCTLLMKKFLLLESYNIPDIGGVYDDETISKNFPMELLKMILINKGLNTDNLSKTQLINELNSYDRTILAFTMVSSKIWGPRI